MSLVNVLEVGGAWFCVNKILKIFKFSIIFVRKLLLKPVNINKWLKRFRSENLILFIRGGGRSLRQERNWVYWS